MRLSGIHFCLTLRLFYTTSLQGGRVLLALYALELGAAPLTIGVLAASYSAVPMVTTVLAGKLADRYGARWPLMIAAVIGALGMLVPYFVPGLPGIFLAIAIIGLLGGVQSVLLQNLVGLLSTPDNRSQNFSTASLVSSISAFLGPLITGFAIEHSGHAVTCLYFAFLMLVPFVMLAFRGGALRGGAQQPTQAGGGVRALLAEPGIRKALLTTSLLNIGTELYQFYMPVYTHSIGLLPSVIGMVLAMNAAAAFVVRLILPRLITRFTEEKMLVYTLYVGAVSLTLVPFFTNAVALGLISFAFGLGMGCGQPIISMLMFSNAPQGRSGEAMGLRMTVIYLTKLIGPVTFGSIGSAFGLPPIFWINALMLSAGAVISRPKALPSPLKGKD